MKFFSRIINQSLAIALFAFVFAIYLFTYSRALDLRADEGNMFAVTESIVKHGQFNIDQANNLQYMHAASIGNDGARYAKYGLGQVVAAAPLYTIGLFAPTFGLIDLVLLLNPIATAVSAVLVLLTAIELGATRGRALIIALIYACGTMVWVYAKNFYNEPLTTLGFALASWGIAVLLQRQRNLGALIAGTGVAIAILTRTSAAVVVPILLLVTFAFTGKRRWHATFATLVPIFLALSVIALYNWTRFGNPLQTGYSDETFSVAPWVGAFGMLFAPGRSLFIYAPIMLAAIPGALMIRPLGLRVWIIGASLAVLFLNGAWWSWWGAWSWGPRFLVPLMPLLILGLVNLLDGWKRIFVIALAVPSVLMQLPGVLVYRTIFFWDVMQKHASQVPDEFSLYTFDVFMPLTNLREALKGNLDLAWKPGQLASFDQTGFIITLSGALLAGIALALAWRGNRAMGWVSLIAIIGITTVALIHYQQADQNPYASLVQLMNQRTTSDALILISDSDTNHNLQLWNVNRSARRIIGVPTDTGQMQIHTMPLVRQALKENRPIWYLQIEPSPPSKFIAEMEYARLCHIEYDMERQAQLIRWIDCHSQVMQ